MNKWLDQVVILRCSLLTGSPAIKIGRNRNPALHSSFVGCSQNEKTRFKDLHVAAASDATRNKKLATREGEGSNLRKQEGSNYRRGGFAKLQHDRNLLHNF